jgi:hypothetical protein
VAHSGDRSIDTSDLVPRHLLWPGRVGSGRTFIGHKTTRRSCSAARNSQDWLYLKAETERELFARRAAGGFGEELLFLLLLRLLTALLLLSAEGVSEGGTLGGGGGGERLPLNPPTCPPEKRGAYFCLLAAQLL